MTVLDEARNFRRIIEQATKSLDDKTASEAVSLFPKLKQDGSLIKAGTRILHNSKLYKAGVDLWDTAENSPENAPTLWAELQYKNGIRIIPKQIDVTTLFSKNELGWWDDVLYLSKADNNVYTPEQYPDNWEVVNDET